MHYNENAGRSQASTAAGDLRYAIVFPKFKHGDFTVRALKSNPTTGNLYLPYLSYLRFFFYNNCLSEGYIDKLMELLFHHVVKDPQPYLDFSGQMAVPEKLCSVYSALQEGDMGHGSLRTHEVCDNLLCYCH